jgi:drug/metabolite transporter (DMT)-like permease
MASRPRDAMNSALIWIPATLLAAAGQTARNAMQRQLTEKIGTVGATQVRFLYGFPFALIFLAGILAATGEALPRPGSGFVGFFVMGALSQIAATALMLAAMRERSFSVVTALLKTEAVQIALFGALVLGDHLPGGSVVAIVVATLGVILMTFHPRGDDLSHPGLRPLVLGLAAAGIFALAAIGYRGAILALDGGGFLVRASTALCWGLGLQTAILCGWMLLLDRGALLGSLREWRSSLFAGFLGAAASQFWFIGFALTAAANVRTLALVEILMAQFVSRKLAQATSPREIAGMALVLVGVSWLLYNAA